MSYILDALRRADAERDRGSVPGLHTQPAPLPSADDLPPRRPAAWLWPAGGVTAALLAALVWWALGRDTPSPERVASVPAVMPAAAPAVIAPPAVPLQPVPAMVPLPPAPAPARAVVADQVKRLPPAAATAPERKSASPVPAVVSKPPTAASVDARIYKLNELPDAVRRQVPALVVGGAMYSKTPANRMLIVNGQLFHEGDTMAPGLTLEQIKLKSAVLKLDGYRVGIDY